MQHQSAFNGKKDTDKFDLLMNGWEISVLYKKHNIVLRMKYLQRRYRYYFTNINTNFILKLADVFMLDYINQPDVLQMIILL